MDDVVPEVGFAGLKGYTVTTRVYKLYQSSASKTFPKIVGLSRTAAASSHN